MITARLLQQRNGGALCRTPWQRRAVRVLYISGRGRRKNSCAVVKLQPKLAQRPWPIFDKAGEGAPDKADLTNQGRRIAERLWCLASRK